MAWTDLSAAFGYGTKLTSTQQQQLRDNVVWVHNFVNSCNLTDHAPLLGSGTGVVTALDVGTPGAIMIGQGAADPQWKILGGAITVDSGGTTAFVDASVSQSKLKTSSGEVSVSVPAEGTASTSALPGGYYGFLPEVKTNNATGNIFLSRFYKACSTSYAAVACEFHNTHPTTAYTGYANQYYVTASGEVFWIFILRDKDTKQILHVWAAPDHPCFGTSGDPSVTPHPFAGIYDKVKHEIIVINPTIAEEIFINNNKKDSFIESLFELYDINEESSISWPNKEITLGLPKDRDWRFVLPGTLVVPIKGLIPKPNYILCKSLRRRRKVI